MTVYSFFKLVFAFIVLFMCSEVNSQDIIFENPDSWSICDSNSVCVPVRRCRVIRNRRDWRTAGVTCEYGYGESRSVCCPRRSRSPPRPPRPNNATPARISTTTTTPRQPPRRPANPTFSSLTNCGESRTGNDRVVYVMGGENATEGAWPWMVAIRRRESSGTYAPWCTGFLIDRIHVLTAAHCFDDRGTDPTMYTTHIGRVNQYEADQFSVMRIRLPEGYRSGMFYDDIAVMTLDREVNFPNFNPVCLPDGQLRDMDLTNYGTTVAGWGAERPGGKMTTFLMQLSGIPVVSNRQCNQIFRQRLTSFRRQFPRGIDSGFLCAGFLEGGKDSCGGDSGGPLMYRQGNRWYAVGIVSFGSGCGRAGMPGGYTRVSSYLDWIRQNTRN